jgi:hypothetical protein
MRTKSTLILIWIVPQLQSITRFTLQQTGQRTGRGDRNSFAFSSHFCSSVAAGEMEGAAAKHPTGRLRWLPHLQRHLLAQPPPNGLATNAWFEYSSYSSLSFHSSTSPQSVGSGTTSQPVNATLVGLSIGTTYYFRIAALLAFFVVSLPDETCMNVVFVQRCISLTGLSLPPRESGPIPYIFQWICNGAKFAAN